MELRRARLQEILDGSEGPLPVGSIGGIHIVVNALKTEASADTVAALSPG